MSLAFTLPDGTALTGERLWETCGFLPQMLDENNPRPAAEQIDAGYQHGGGFRPLPGFAFDPVKLTLTYPGDPSLKAVAVGQLRDEKIILFEDEWVVIVAPSGNFQAARVD